MSWPRSVYWGGVQAAVMQEEEAGQDSTSRQAGAMSVPEILLPPCELEEWEEEGVEGGGRGKVRLVRSHAIRDSASPPPPGRSSPHHHHQQQQQTCSAESVLAADQRSIGTGTGRSSSSIPSQVKSHC